MTYRSDLDFPAKERPSNFDSTRAGNALDDGFTAWHNYYRLVSNLLHTDKSRGTKLVDLGVCAAVQVQCNPKAFAAGLVTPSQDGSVIPTDFDISYPLRSGSVNILQHQCFDGIHSVVGTDWLCVYAELIARTGRDRNESVRSEC